MSVSLLGILRSYDCSASWGGGTLRIGQSETDPPMCLSAPPKGSQPPTSVIWILFFYTLHE